MKELYLSSIQNPRIKKLLALQSKSSLRRESGLFVVEGQQEIGHCVDAGYEIASLFYCPDILESEGKTVEFSHLSADEYFTVSAEVYQKIAYRGSTEGVIAEVKVRQYTLDDLRLDKAPLIIVLERVEKPGNLGAVLRSADAANVSAVIVCDPLTDIYNPNLIRSSVGAVFTVPCVSCTSEECIQ